MIKGGTVNSDSVLYRADLWATREMCTVSRCTDHGRQKGTVQPTDSSQSRKGVVYLVHRNVLPSTDCMYSGQCTVYSAHCTVYCTTWPSCNKVGTILQTNRSFQLERMIEATSSNTLFIPCCT